jgi:hypothetical protein
VLASLLGNAVFAAWQQLLIDEPALCVEADSMPQVFDLYIRGMECGLPF